MYRPTVRPVTAPMAKATASGPRHEGHAHRLDRARQADGGKFPYDLEDILRFGSPLASHGSADMPTWGATFRVMGDEAITKMQISNLIDHMESLQSSRPQPAVWPRRLLAAAKSPLPPPADTARCRAVTCSSPNWGENPNAHLSLAPPAEPPISGKTRNRARAGFRQPAVAFGTGVRADADVALRISSRRARGGSLSRARCRRRARCLSLFRHGIQRRHPTRCVLRSRGSSRQSTSCAASA